MQTFIRGVVSCEVLEHVSIVPCEANTYARCVLPQLHVMGADWRDVARAAQHYATQGYQLSEGQGHKSLLLHSSWRLSVCCYHYLLGENKSY